MPLTPEQQAQLEALQAEASRPEPRTETGLKGVLHAVLDVVSGNVAHLPPDGWELLHATVEHYDEAHDTAAEAPAAAEPGPNTSSVSAPAGGTEDAGFHG